MPVSVGAPMTTEHSLVLQAERLAARYEKNPIIRALVQLIPWGVGSAADVAITTVLARIREERAREFFDQLASGELELTQEQIATEDFLHAYFATARAALNTRRREKIRLFAQLFANYAGKGLVGDSDVYEEYLSILDDLSYREFQILLILKRHQDCTPRQPQQNDLQWSSTFWDAFLDSVVSEVGIPRQEIPGILARLNRTGLYKTIVGTFLGYGGDQGLLTPNFDRFLHALGLLESRP